MPWYGSKRHPATDTPVPDASGSAFGSNTCAQAVVTNGPSRQAVQLASSMALAVNTGSPMSRGNRVWAGDPGYGVHRFSGRLGDNPFSVQGEAVQPVATPLSVRYGMNYGASQGQGSVYPSTGTIADAGTLSLATMSMGQLGNLGYGS